MWFHTTTLVGCVRWLRGLGQQENRAASISGCHTTHFTLPPVQKANENIISDVFRTAGARAAGRDRPRGAKKAALAGCEGQGGAGGAGRSPSLLLSSLELSDTTVYEP